MSTPAQGRAIQKRHILVAMCFFATLICYIDRVSISVAIIPMAEQFGWSNTTKGWVLSSFFIGYLVAMIPGGWLSGRYGGHIVLGVALVLWSLFTLVTPAAAAMSLTALVIVRIGMGLGEAATFPAAMNLFARWLPAGERTRAVTLNLGGISAGTVVGLSVAGLIVAELGWEAVFHIFGAVGVVFAGLWFLLVRGSPATHPTISAEERALLAGCVEGTTAGIRTPWRRLLSHPAVWALTINHFCSTWLLYLMLTWLPSYFRDVQHLGIASSGVFAVGPWIAMFVVSNLAAVYADRMIARGVAVTRVRKLMQCTALLGSSAALLVASQATTPGMALATLCVAMGLLGLTWPGFAGNHLDIAPRHADVLYAFTNTFGTIPGIVGVAATGWLLDLTGGYTATFLVAAGVNVVGALVWLIWATGEPIVD